MKLKKELYRTKELPIIIRLIYGSLLIIGIGAKLILKLLFSLIYIVYKQLETFNKRKLQPLANATNDYLYNRACDAFECTSDEELSNKKSTELEATLPWLINISNIILTLMSWLIGKKKNTNKRDVAKKNSYKYRRGMVQKNKGAVNTYLSKFQTLFKKLDY